MASEPAILHSMKLALKIRPQRSNQYSNMVETLAEPELRASPLGPAISELGRVALGGQSYLLVSIEDGRLDRQECLRLLAQLGTISEVYEYFAEVGGVEGPFLRPLALPWQPFISPEIAEVRRYKGKTNEIFTRVLLNAALFAGAYATSRERLRILDPLAGGGTTLFVALAAGYDAFGIEQKRQDVETTRSFCVNTSAEKESPSKRFASIVAAASATSLRSGQGARAARRASWYWFMVIAARPRCT